jgi:ABC-2 type transport system permease protein
MKLNTILIQALAKRDLKLFFTNPTGYVFITLFIFISAGAAFWQERFFLNNLANLSELNQLLPLLLVFFIPALTMSVWSSENKQGTDELLLTMPASDMELTLGKYLSVLGIYAISLVLSLSHVVVLLFLGSPDLGLMLANYLGYFFMGAALLSLGMVASLLTSNATIAFVLGIVFVGIAVYLDTMMGLLGADVGRFFQSISLRHYFQGFARGVISFSGIMYFLSIALLGLYLNVVWLGRRHWPKKADGLTYPQHFAIRFVSLFVAISSLNVMFNSFDLRADVTAEGLHSLSKETRTILKELDSKHPVVVHAYLSPEVPQAMVQTRENIVGFLNEIQAASGGKVQVQITETKPYTEEARTARQQFGISPVETMGIGGMQASRKQLYMGLGFVSGPNEHVIPFFDAGLPVEYELIRSIRVVSDADRKKIGVVKTPANIFGGLDYQTFQTLPEWQVVSELRKQYEVVEISAETPIEQDLAGLLVVLPSALSQTEMDHLQAVIKKGMPTLVLCDPLLMEDVALSPSEKSGANNNPMMRSRGPQPQPKGNIARFMNEIGLNWMPQEIVWDGYNPHPQLSSLPPEVIFVGEGNRNPQAFDTEFEATSGLQEVVLLYPGFFEESQTTPYTFRPLLQTGKVSGRINYNQTVQRSFFGPQVLPSQYVPHTPMGVQYTLAAHVSASENQTSVDSSQVNLIAVADIDFIGGQFFEIRKAGYQNLNFDNISFFLNCMDYLVGDKSFIDLRKKRSEHRTLQALESQMMRFAQKRRQQEKEAESEAARALQDAQARLDRKVKAISNRTDLDEQSKKMMSRNVQEVESNKFEAIKTQIEAEKKARIEQSLEDMEASIRAIQNTIKLMAVLLPPVPVFGMGIWIYIRRKKREKEGMALSRRRKSTR